MSAEYGSEEPDKSYIKFENVVVTVDNIKEASTWCRATMGMNSSFTQAMDSKENPLADWSRGNRYQGLKTWSSDRIPGKEQIAAYLDSFLASLLNEPSASPETVAVPSSPPGSSRRNPAWAWDEVVLACDLVMRNSWHGLEATDPRVIELSALLRDCPCTPQKHDFPTFAIPTG